jgi:hypothetical protein
MSRTPRKGYAVAARRLALGALVVLALSLAGCEGWVAIIADDVKESYGLDIRSPQQVAGAALGSQLFGDQEKADGLDVYRALRRVEYEQQGLIQHRAANFVGARENYAEALRWTPTSGTSAQQQKRSDLYYRIGLSYNDELLTTSDQDRQMELNRRASRAYAQAAALEQDPDQKDLPYYRAALAAYEGGDPASACTYMANAHYVGDGRSGYEEYLKSWNCQY